MNTGQSATQDLTKQCQLRAGIFDCEKQPDRHDITTKKKAESIDSANIMKESGKPGKLMKISKLCS